MQSVKHTGETPPDLAGIVCLKFGFNITITEQSFHKTISHIRSIRLQILLVDKMQSLDFQQ
uniref:Uncharacterized protein n=1 Tax=Arundo donax TaxID=35708 RepID=A0A0A9HEJ5_ARUDO